MELLQSEGIEDDTKGARHVHIAILGTGFAGVGMAIGLKRHGYNDFVVLEKASEVGGTWRDNTYPGCACDVQSHLYSFSFALNPKWSHSFSPQSEIYAYLRMCIDKFGIRPNIQWECELQDASWNEDEQRWRIRTSQGLLLANILVLGNGPLREPSLPAIPGIEHFEGMLFHSSQWRHDYDLTGKRVAVVGTGASAIQFVPRIQPKVRSLILFQRTAPWIVPRLDAPIANWKRTLFSILPFTQRAVRSLYYWQRELTALAFIHRPKMLQAGMQIAREHLEAQVIDPVLREKLTPHYTMGCKRVLLSDDYYPAVSQPNVEVVTDRIREVRGQSVVTEDGTEYEVDTLICATGFHVTDTEFAHRVHGRDGQSLADVWRDGPHAYYGTTVAGFPNMFLLIGPNTGLGHNSMIFMIEAQTHYILDCLRMMDQKHVQTVEIRPDSEVAYNKEMQQRMKGTVWTSGCSSWYLDAHGNNTTIWPGFTFEFWYRTREFDPEHYTLIPQQQPARHPTVAPV